MGSQSMRGFFERRRRSFDNQQSFVQASSANAINTITVPGAAGFRILVDTIDVVLTTAVSGNDVAVELREYTATGPLRWRTYIGNAAPRGTRVGLVREFDPFEFPPGVAAVLTIGAAGAAAVTDATLTVYTEPDGYCPPGIDR